MPIFEYHCRHCDHQFEIVILSSGDKISCPACSSTALKKQVSVFSARTNKETGAPSGEDCSCTPQTCGCH